MGHDAKLRSKRMAKNCSRPRDQPKGNAGKDGAKKKKRSQRLLPRFLSVSRDKVQLLRKEGSGYAGQVAAEWPTKFCERVKSGLCLSGRVKKRILSTGTLVA